MKKKKPVEFKAWAIVDSNGKMECFDHRMPIYWLKRIAEMDRKKLNPEARVVPVKVQI